MTRRTPEEKRALIADQEASGLNIKDWCRANDYSQAQFQDWKKLLRRLDEAALHAGEESTAHAGWAQLGPKPQGGPPTHPPAEPPENSQPPTDPQPRQTDTITIQYGWTISIPKIIIDQLSARLSQVIQALKSCF